MFVRLIRYAGFVAVFSQLFFIRVVSAGSWRDIDPVEFAYTGSEIDPGAGVEILFSETHYNQYRNSEGLSESIERYIRLKVYSELGLDDLVSWKLEYDSDRGYFSELKGRTVKPDGQVYDLSKDQVYDTIIIRQGKDAVAAKSFAFPNVEPGDIVELQFLIKRQGISTMPVLRFEERLPARRITQRMKPQKDLGVEVAVARFNFPEADIPLGERDVYTFEKLNVEAFVEESYSVPKMDLVPVIVFYYFDYRRPSSDLESHWKIIAKRLYEEGKRSFKPNREIEGLAMGLTEGISDDWLKLKALYDYCQNDFINLSYSRDRVTEKEREKIEEGSRPQETVSRGSGWPDDISAVFGALAQACGFEPRWAAMHDNRELRFKAAMALDFVMQQMYVAIEVDGEFRYFRPGNPFLPCGDIEWFTADSAVLIAEPKKGALQKTSMPDADYSVQNRILNGEIDEEGTLKADVSIVYTGYSGWDAKEALSFLKSEEQCQEYFTDPLKILMPLARFEKVEILHRTSHVRPLEVRYQVEVPGYASVTGSRLFFQPFVFANGSPDLFLEKDRKSPLFFKYPSSQKDLIRIQVPAGYTLEQGAKPPPLDLKTFGEYSTLLKVSDSGKVIYERSFRQNIYYLQSEAYSGVKSIFSKINRRDQHTLSYKRVDAD